MEPAVGRDDEGAVVIPRGDPDRERSEGGHREGLHACGRLDDDVEGDRHPHGGEPGAGPQQPEPDEELGQDHDLGEPTHEPGVGEEVERPFGGAAAESDITPLLDAQAQDRAAEPVGVDELREARGGVDDGHLEAHEPQWPKGGRSRLPASTPAPPGIDGQMVADPHEGQPDEEDDEEGSVVMEVGL